MTYHMILERPLHTFIILHLILKHLNLSLREKWTSICFKDKLPFCIQNEIAYIRSKIKYGTMKPNMEKVLILPQTHFVNN